MLLCYTALWIGRGEPQQERALGFIGYRRQRESSGDEVVRIFLECRRKSGEATPSREESPNHVTCGYAVDAVFPADKAPCRLRGVDGVLVLKKFYKLVFSLEERAREHGNDWRSVTESPERLLEHLRYTRNARDFTGIAEPAVSASSEEMDDPDCIKIGEGT